MLRNAGEMVARIWIQRQQQDYLILSGGLDQGRYGRANAREMLGKS